VYEGDLFITCFSPKGPSSNNTHIEITKKSYWVISGLYMNTISFLQLISLYWRITGVCIDVVCTVGFLKSRWENIFILSDLLISTIATELQSMGAGLSFYFWVELSFGFCFMCSFSILLIGWHILKIVGITWALLVLCYSFWSKGKAIPLQALTSPEGSRRLRLPHYMTIGTWSW
jgi:hypothetical protein